MLVVIAGDVVEYAAGLTDEGKITRIRVPGVEAYVAEHEHGTYLILSYGR